MELQRTALIPLPFTESAQRSPGKDKLEHGKVRNITQNHTTPCHATPHRTIVFLPSGGPPVQIQLWKWQPGTEQDGNKTLEYECHHHGSIITLTLQSRGLLRGMAGRCSAA